MYAVFNYYKLVNIFINSINSFQTYFFGNLSKYKISKAVDYPSLTIFLLSHFIKEEASLISIK